MDVSDGGVGLTFSLSIRFYQFSFNSILNASLLAVG
jgi:hypothetical protein